MMKRKTSVFSSLFASSVLIMVAVVVSGVAQSGAESTPATVTYHGNAAAQSKSSKAAAKAAATVDSVDGVEVIRPDTLANAFQSETGEKPLIIQVGFRKLYDQAHIPGSEYIGPGSDEQAREQLAERVKSLPRSKLIVLYCGCCPWTHCPNVKPAYNRLRQMGFNHVKVLYIANNFGDDWVSQGYPTEKGQ